MCIQKAAENIFLQYVVRQIYNGYSNCIFNTERLVNYYNTHVTVTLLIWDCGGILKKSHPELAYGVNDGEVEVIKFTTLNTEYYYNILCILNSCRPKHLYTQVDTIISQLVYIIINISN